MEKTSVLDYKATDEARRKDPDFVEPYTPEPTYSVCETPGCPNRGRIADHPRSATPKVCGMCANPVRIFKSASPTS